MELTENCWIPDINLLNDKFISLKGIGVYIAIDDFGTGYSSLNYLKELSVNIIKLKEVLLRILHTIVTNILFLNILLN